MGFDNQILQYCSDKFLFQDTHNQAGIAHNGGLVPLLKLLDSKNGSLQHNAAFALYGLADNEVQYISYESLWTRAEVLKFLFPIFINL